MTLQDMPVTGFPNTPDALDLLTDARDRVAGMAKELESKRPPAHTDSEKELGSADTPTTDPLD